MNETPGKARREDRLNNEKTALWVGGDSVAIALTDVEGSISTRLLADDTVRW